MTPVYLAQTDTTVGFLSQDAQKLSKIKSRPADKPFIKSYASLKILKSEGGRIPNRFKSSLRRARQTSFVINNIAIRVVDSGPHHALLEKDGWLYSTSANAKGSSYNQAFAFKNADVIVEDARGLFEGDASHIYKINNNKIKKLR